MGLGTYLGYFVSQNGRGHVLGHVKDLGEDSTQIDKVRIYRTNARQYFHADDSDIVGLLCITRALEGGESDIASTHQVYNALAKERPDVLKTLTAPIWYFDRKGETSEGEEGYIRTSIIYMERGEDARVYTKCVTPFSRFSVLRKAKLIKQMGPLFRPLAQPLLRRRDNPPSVVRTIGSHRSVGADLPTLCAAHDPRSRGYPVRRQHPRAAFAHCVQGPCAAYAAPASDASVAGDAGGRGRMEAAVLG